MSKQVKFAAAAKQDLLGIAAYIAEDNPIRAHSFVDELVEACQKLCDYPNRFRLMLGHEETGIRRRVFDNYLIFYQASEGTIYIMRILNRAMDYEKVMFGE